MRPHTTPRLSLLALAQTRLLSAGCSFPPLHLLGRLLHCCQPLLCPHSLRRLLCLCTPYNCTLQHGCLIMAWYNALRSRCVCVYTHDRCHRLVDVSHRHGIERVRTTAASRASAVHAVAFSAHVHHSFWTTFQVFRIRARSDKNVQIPLYFQLRKQIRIQALLNCQNRKALNQQAHETYVRSCPDYCSLHA